MHSEVAKINYQYNGNEVLILFKLQYFYLQYFLKAEDLLDRFDKEFGDALSKEEEKLEEVYMTMMSIAIKLTVDGFMLMYT